MRYEVTVRDETASFETLRDAVDFIERMAGPQFTRAWINNQPIRVSDGHVLGNDWEPFCTNEAWHDVFAPEAYPRIKPREAA